MSDNLIAVIAVVSVGVIVGGLILFDNWANRGHQIEKLDERVEKLEDEIESIKD